MKLYVFDSCPYCTRTRTLIGLKDIPCDIDCVVAGALPDHLKGKVGRFSVPILEIPNAAEGLDGVMQESSQIIDHLDGVSGERLLSVTSPSKDVQDWLDTNRPAINALCYPRMPALKLPELGSPKAMEYFLSSRPESIGMSLLDALAKTNDLTSQLKSSLEELSVVADTEIYLQRNRPISFDDLVVFAELRNLTMVKELRLPATLAQFVVQISQEASVPVYRGIAAADMEEMAVA
ncbi:glutaredoxin 2 [Roseibium sp. SCP14]|uniref:glutaredoxin 2 n=1 Tax=Roseibium sp. SCP14 TaxID=3141375 RepID=UPI00333841DB